jgi:hypothetical protein
MSDMTTLTIAAALLRAMFAIAEYSAVSKCTWEKWKKGEVTSLTTADTLAFQWYVTTLSLLSAAVIYVGSTGPDSVERTCTVKKTGFLGLQSVEECVDGEASYSTLAVVALLGGALAFGAAIPGFKKLDGPLFLEKSSVISLAALGAAAWYGAIPSGVALGIATNVYVGNGVQWFLAPKLSVDMYKFASAPGKRALSVVKLCGATHCCTGAYLIALPAYGHAFGLAVSLAVGSVFAFKYALLDANKDATSAVRPLAYGVASALLAARCVVTP